MVATVEDDRITKLRPDPDHPLSQGYACPKGIAMLDVQNDPDRVVHPLKKGADGEFERVSWDEALDDIGERLRAIIQRHGKKSVAWYMGNPGAFSYSHPLWSKGFVDGLGSPHYYTAGSQDVNNRFAASALLYGSPLVVPIPDLNRTRFLFMVGANPMVSHGSVLTAPRIREQLHDIVEPRRPRGRRRPAPVGDRAPVRARAGHARHRRVAAALDAAGDLRRGAREPTTSSPRTPTGADALADMARPFAPEETAARTGVPAETVRELARAMAEPGSRGVRPHRLLPRALRHARRVPDRRAQRRHRQPRQPGRRGLRPPADRARRRGREGRARQLRQGALALRRLPRRDRQPAGVAPAEGDHDARRAPDPRAVRLGGQPGAVRAGRRRARARRSASSSCASRSTST